MYVCASFQISDHFRLMCPTLEDSVIHNSIVSKDLNKVYIKNMMIYKFTFPQ